MQAQNHVYQIYIDLYIYLSLLCFDAVQTAKFNSTNIKLRPNLAQTTKLIYNDQFISGYSKCMQINYCVWGRCVHACSNL